MIVYLDASIVLRVILRDGPPLAMWGRWETAYSSELLGVEARRTVDRLRLIAVLDDAAVVAAIAALARIERGIQHVALSRSVLWRASLPMGTVVKTLDALHLATALLLREQGGIELTFATHDTRQATAARALGFACVGVDGE
jgi:predicted nucleic acid-binding protein